MVNRGWLYGLMIFLAQTCNPYYSANDSRNQHEQEIVLEGLDIDDDSEVFIPKDAFEIDETIEVEPPRIRRVPPFPPMVEEENIFVVVEDMPRFPGCEQKAIGKSELKKCSEGEMMRFISENIQYPQIAKSNKIEGRVIIKFMVGKDGSISKTQVLRDLGAGCGKEAERMVKMMPRWIPGKQRGRPVNVWFTLPVSFELPKEKLEEKPILYAPQDINESPPMPEGKKIFKVVEDMPRFSGCEDQGLSKSERKKCSDKKMVEFISNNIRYPELARANGIEGRVIIKFMVGKDGSVSKVQVLREPGGGCGKEAERVVKMMPNFTPAMQRGKTVKVWFTLPVSFKLPKEKLEEEPILYAPVDIIEEPVQEERIFKVVEDMPRFSGCEDKGLNKKEVNKCAEDELLKFVYSNIVYPQEARKNGVEGRVIMQWVVRADGSITDINVLREPGGGCGEEAVRVVKLMPKFIPGKQKGKAVAVKYTFPVSFKLQKDRKRKRN